MGWINKMSLKKALFTMIVLCLSLSTLLSISVYSGLFALRNAICPAQMSIGYVSGSDTPSVTYGPVPSEEAIRAAVIIDLFQMVLPVFIFVTAILITVSLFYRVKLKEPLQILSSGAGHIIENDLDFTSPLPPNQDELGQLCIAFETMRKTLLANNRTLWRQAEERRRLNAAFAHDLRNPVTVLKGTVKLLQKGVSDEDALTRLSDYTARIEQYIETMGSIQRLEDVPVEKKPISIFLLQQELAETTKLLSPDIPVSITVSGNGTANLDWGLFFTVAENLIGNAARFAKNSVTLHLELKEEFLWLSVEDDGPGYPAELLRQGPKPFGKMEENAAHFGMGLYSSQTLCLKHGGALKLENLSHGAKAAASFQINGYHKEKESIFYEN